LGAPEVQGAIIAARPEAEGNGFWTCQRANGFYEEKCAIWWILDISIYIYVLFMLIQSYTMGLTSKQSPQQVRKYDSMHNKYRKSMSWEYWITSEIRFLTTGRKSVTWWRLLYGCSLKPQVPRANTGVSCWIPTNEFPGAGDQPTWYEQQLYGRTES
jgi:hypothetical protein